MDSNNFLEKMGVRTSKRRKELHLTQEQLAEKMGVSLQTVSCIELGKKAVRPENLANMCFYLGVTTDYILYGKRSEKQMDDTVAKLTELSPEAYDTVHNLIDLLVKEKI